jgi:histidine triad (HIT) family protein
MSIFQKILDGELPAKIIFRNEEVCAFEDVHPQAPIHWLFIPVKPLAQISEMTPQDDVLIGRLLRTATEVARQAGLTDYRLVINNGAGAGQSVFHLHLHLLAKRDFNWPPG